MMNTETDGIGIAVMGVKVTNVEGRIGSENFDVVRGFRIS